MDDLKERQLWCRDRLDACAFCGPYSPRSSRRRILPLALRGNDDTNSMPFGTLKDATLWRANRRMSSRVAVHPLLCTTIARGTSPQRVSGIPMTATSAILG